MSHHYKSIFWFLLLSLFLDGFLLCCPGWPLTSEFQKSFCFSLPSWDFGAYHPSNIVLETYLFRFPHSYSFSSLFLVSYLLLSTFPFSLPKVYLSGFSVSLLLLSVHSFLFLKLSLPHSSVFLLFVPTSDSPSGHIISWQQLFCLFVCFLFMSSALFFYFKWFMTSTSFPPLPPSPDPPSPFQVNDLSFSNYCYVYTCIHNPLF